LPHGDWSRRGDVADVHPGLVAGGDRARLEDADPGRGLAGQAVEGELAGRQEVVGGRVADQGEGARPEQADPDLGGQRAEIEQPPGAGPDRLAAVSARARGVVSAAAWASARARGVTEAWPDAEAAGRLRRALMETSASTTRGTRTLARTPASRSRPASTVAPVPPEAAWPLQLPSSRERTRPSAHTRTSAAVWRPRRAETSAEISWAPAAPALRASRPPLGAATPIARFIHKCTWSSPW
jgi:hypothetical protein